MEGAPILDGLMEVFPQVNLSTLIEVSIQFKDDIDAAADHVIQNVLPNMVLHPSHPNTNEDLFCHGLQQASDHTSNQLGLDPVDNSSNSNTIQSYLANKIIVKQLKRSSTDLSSDVSTSGEDHTSEGFSSDSRLTDSQLRLTDSQLQQTSCETNTEISASEGDMPLYDNGLRDVIKRSSYTVKLLESLDDVISNEQHKKATLLSNAAAISEILHQVEINEEETKLAISAVNEADTDILRKVDELKEMTALVIEDNDKVAGEIFAEKSILATEAQELQDRLFNISEEIINLELTIEQMNHTLQRRLAACEEERVAAEKAKLEREASAQKILREQQLSLEAANKNFRWLQQKAQENKKLKELLVDQGHSVDALHGEMLGIFDSIMQLKLKVDMKTSSEEAMEQDSSSLPCSAVFFQDEQVSSSSLTHLKLKVDMKTSAEEAMEQDSSSLPCSAVFFQGKQDSAVDVPPQPSSGSLLKSASSKSGSMESLASKGSWSSFAEANSKDDEKIVDISDGHFSLDDSWDVVDDNDEVASPKSPLYTACSIYSRYTN